MNCSFFLSVFFHNSIVFEDLYASVVASRKSYRGMYSICSCCLNVATNNWKVHNGKVETHFLNKPPLSSYVCKSVYDVDIAVFVESSIAGSLG
jgi:hypothetical protein